MNNTKEVSITNQDGTISKYVLNKWSPMDGRSIVSGYPLSSIPKMGDYSKNEALMVKLMGYVSAHTVNGDLLPLCSDALINNHVHDWYSLATLEVESFRFNVSWLEDDESWSKFKTTWVDSAISAVSEVLLNALKTTDLQLAPTGE